MRARSVLVAVLALLAVALAAPAAGGAAGAPVLVAQSSSAGQPGIGDVVPASEGTTGSGGAQSGESASAWGAVALVGGLIVAGCAFGLLVFGTGMGRHRDT